MTSPVSPNKRGKSPGKESELIKKGRAAAARKKDDPEGHIKNVSNAAKQGTKAIVANRAKLSPEQVAAAVKKQTKPNLKPSQIAEMEALWESGEVTLKELAERFNRDQAMISRHMTLNNVTKGSRAEEYARIIRDKIANELAGEPGENAKRIKKMKENYLAYNEMINRLAQNEVAVMREKKLPAQAILPNLRALKELASIFTATRSENWALLGVIDFEQRVERDDIPELLISELTGEDIERMRIEQLQMANLTGEDAPVNMEGLSSVDLSDVVEEGE